MQQYLVRVMEKELKDWVDEQTRSAIAKCMELQRELGQAIMHHKN